MSHSLRYTLFYLTSRSHVSEVAFKKKEKKSCPFISVKVALTGSHKQERLSCLSHSQRIYAAGAPEELSVIWQHWQYFSSRGGVAIAEKKRRRKEKVIEYERNWKGRLIPRCSVMQAGDPNRGTRQQYGQQLAQDTVLAALHLAYHNRLAAEGGKMGRESSRGGEEAAALYMSLYGY